MHTIQFSRTEPALPRPEGLFSAHVSRFGSGTLRRPASVCGGGNLRFRLRIVNLFFRARRRRVLLAEASSGSVSLLRFPGFATSETVFEEERLSTSPLPVPSTDLLLFPLFRL
jgi:hypothetical protein